MLRWCRTIFALSCLGVAAATNKWPRGSCIDDSESSGTCCDVTEGTNAKCNERISWAMQADVRSHPGRYDKYTVKQGDSFANFQCALFWIGYDEAHEEEEKGSSRGDHSCPRPCSSTVLNGCEGLTPNFKESIDKCLDYVPATDCKCGVITVGVAGDCADPESEACKVLSCTEVQCKPDAECPKNGTNHHLIALIALLVIALLTVLFFFVVCEKKEKVAKKRAAKKDVRKPAPRESSFGMQPVPEKKATTAFTTKQPYSMIMPQQPVAAMPQPIQNTAYSMVMAQQPVAAMPQPIQTTAMPMAVSR